MNSRQAFRKILKVIYRNMETGRISKKTARDIAEKVIQIAEIQNPVEEQSQSSISDLSIVSTDEMLVAKLGGGVDLISYPQSPFKRYPSLEHHEENKIPCYSI